MQEMTPGERFVTAMWNREPDRVPVAPDISTYVPVRRTGRPFWEVLLEGKYPHWKAYLDAAVAYGLDAWMAPVLWLPCQWDPAPVEWNATFTYDRNQDAMKLVRTVRTPDGDLTQEDICFRNDPPATAVKMIKNLSRDFRKFKWTLSMPRALDRGTLETLRTECHQHGFAFGFTLTYPGFHNWNSFVEGGVEALAYAEMDIPELLAEWQDIEMARGTRLMELAVEARPDYILFGGSGTITLASPDLARKYALPALQKWSAMARAAAIPTMLHSCGKSRVLADMLAAETDVNMLNPLEIPPMGDVDLAEIKRAMGHRLSFMGNLHTTNVMLRGTPHDVRCASLQALLDAGVGGGFVLSTGDQCGRETPDENLMTMVETAREFGRYPLDVERIRRELEKLS